MRLIVLYFIFIQSFAPVFAQVYSSDKFVNTQLQQLKSALEYYTAINESEAWETISIKSLNDIHAQSKIKQALRKNLCLTGDLPDEVITISAMEEDSAFFYALKYFQYRHRLPEDGMVNMGTIEALNIPICERIEQIKINIKRWEDFLIEGENLYLLINIPDYTLSVIKNGMVVFKLNVIVGKTTNPTARFYGDLRQIVINPSWIVPRSIVRNELFDKIKKDPNYLKRNHFKLYKRGSRGNRDISWNEIVWENSTASNFDYLLEQTPGAWNSLGKVKFLFPNNHEIYLHDTPEKGLFNNHVRAYSHGCIRVENSIELANYLLNERTNISSEQLEQYLKNSETKGIYLDYPIPVALSYFTAFTDENGALHFRDDIYNLDIAPAENPNLETGKLY